MTIDDIQSIIKSDETRTLELKKTTGELKDGMHSACAFLNTDGGWLIIGVPPKSLKIVGQQVTDNTRQEIANALTSLEPAVNIKVEYVDVPEHPGNQAIAIYFEPWIWGHIPYTCNGRPYYKAESTTKVMPRVMYDERLRQSKPQYFAWERQEADGITIADLDEDRIRGAVRLGIEGGRFNEAALTEPIETLLQKSELLNNGKLNNAAVMLFSKKRYGYPQLRLRMARFRGTGKNEFGDNQQAEGNFFDLLDTGMSFLFKHLNLSGKIVGLRRMEQLEIPVEALREALVNSLCHRRYDQPGKAGGSQKAGGSTIEKQGVLTQKEAKSIIERGLKNEGGYQNEGGSKFIAKIIEVMNFEYMSVPEIMEKTGRKDRDRFNQNYINPALKLGIIERKYPDQPFHPYQRFRLTEKAMHIKYSQEEK